MKKVVKVIVMTLFALVGALFMASGIYEFIGLFGKSMKNHGWERRKKGYSEPVSLKQRFINAKMAANDCMKDVEEGWEWLRR